MKSTGKYIENVKKWHLVYFEISLHKSILYWEYKLVRSVSLKIASAVVNGS